MNFLDLFAGIGGFRMGMEQAGHKCVGFCEIDKFARESYKAIHNTEGEVEMHDITTVTDEFIRSIGSVDIICGGFPCQAFSIAGKRRGFEDTRGTLFFEIARFANILRPRYLFLENVKGLLSHRGGDTFETILGTLDGLGYDVEWNVLNSKEYVPQNRERVFIIGHLRGKSTRQVFPFERDDRKAGQATPAVVATGKDIAYNLNARYEAGPRVDKKMNTVVSVGNSNPSEKGMNGEEMFTLTAQDRHGVMQVGNVIETDSFGGNPHRGRVYDPEGLSPCLNCMGGGGLEPKILQKPRGNNSGGTHEIAPTVTSNSYESNNLLDVGGIYTNDSERFNRGTLPGLSRTLKANKADAGILIREATSKGYSEATPGDSVNIAHPNSKTRRGRVGKQIANTLFTGEEQAVVTQEYRIRKLTPRECWRLQGFPDWAFDKAAKVNSNSQLYKQAGNSVTVPVIYDIARRL